MTNPPLRVAVVGCGDVARKHHLPNWKELVGEGRVTLAAVCDAEPNRAALCRDEFEAEDALTRRSYRADLSPGDARQWAEEIPSQKVELGRAITRLGRGEEQ
ncbi:MAG: hypothetical protein ACLFU6_03470 [Candidatus Hydrogenedentota bacterium]